MRDYSKMSSSFWTGETGRALRKHPDAQRLAVYLMTSPHANMAGLFHMPIMYMANETGMETDQVWSAMKVLSEMRFALYDERLEYVWVVNAALYQLSIRPGGAMSKSDKRHGAVQRIVDGARKSSLYPEFMSAYRQTLSLGTFPEAPSEGHPPSQEAPSEGHPPSPRGSGAGAGAVKERAGREPKKSPTGQSAGSHGESSQRRSEPPEHAEATAPATTAFERDPAASMLAQRPANGLPTPPSRQDVSDDGPCREPVSASRRQEVRDAWGQSWAEAGAGAPPRLIGQAMDGAVAFAGDVARAHGRSLRDAAMAIAQAALRLPESKRVWALSQVDPFATGGPSGGTGAQPAETFAEKKARYAREVAEANRKAGV